MNKDTFQELRKVIAEKLTLGGRFQEGQPDLLVHNDAEIRNNLLVHKNLSILGDVQTDGSFNLNDVTLAGDLTVNGKSNLGKVVLATQIENTIIVEDKLSVGSSATIASCNSETPSNFLEFTRTNHISDDNIHIPVTAGDDLGALLFKGSDGTNWIKSAKIYSEVDGDVTSNNVPGKLIFATTPHTGDGISIDRLIINSNGNVGISTSDPLVSLHLNTTDALKIPAGNNIVVENKTYIVTVEDRGNGNKYIIDGSEHPELTFYKGDL